MILKKFLVISLSMFLGMCQNDDTSPENCELVDCAAPITHTGLYVYFVDKETDENSFASGSLTLEDIIITDNDNNVLEKEIKEIELHSSDLPFRSHLLIIQDDFNSRENTFNFKIKNNLEFNIVVDVIVYTSGCCPGTHLENLRIEDVDHNTEYSIYTPIIYINW